MENLPTKGVILSGVEILLYISQYIPNIYGFFLDAGRGGGGERDRDISGKKNSCVQSGSSRGYEVFASASCIVLDNETISPS